ncbi:MAG: carbohydrate-binding domain-containing protein, partial [bacterium]
ARGAPARGEWPTVRVAADGETLSTFAVTTDYWWFYETKAVLGAGKHIINVVLLNGFRDPAAGEKRFLYLNRLAVYRDPGEERGAGKLAKER